MTSSSYFNEKCDIGRGRQKVVAIVQARIGSTRLPGKVMLDLAGKPVLTRVINRLRRCSAIDEIIIATTTLPVDDVIADYCHKNGMPIHRGSEIDVLSRYYEAAKAYNADIIVRITSDCPLIEPEITEKVINELLVSNDIDYCSNALDPRTFPRGLDSEAFTFASLSRAQKENTNPEWREHVTPYIYRNPEIFRLKAIRNPVDYSHMRWTLDTQDDLKFIRKIYDFFGNDAFSWHDVLNLLNQNPEWLSINSHIKQKLVA